MHKLAIVGSHTATRDNAPWDDADYDIWVFNEAANCKWVKRWDGCFQLHKPEVYIRKDNKKDLHNWDWMKQHHGKPIFMQAPDSRVPDCEVYPLDEAIDLVGKRYLTATVSHACALAVIKGYTAVEFWGVGMDNFTEYAYQVDGFKFWMGYLIGRLGKDNVIMHCGEKLFEAPIYGYEGDYRFGNEFFQDRATRLDADWTSTDKVLQYAKKNVERQFKLGAYVKAFEAINDAQKAAMLCGQTAGALQEAERYALVGDRLVDRNAFETTAAQAQIDGEDKKEEMFRVSGRVEYVWNVWNNNHRPEALNELARQVSYYVKVAYDTGAQYGIYTENLSYIHKFDEMVRANGGYIAPAPVTLPQMVTA